MRESALQSIIMAAATLVAVLAVSLLLADRYLADEDLEAPAAARRDCLAFDGCRAASEELKRAYNDPNACDGAGARVCLVPMGDVPKDIVDGLVAHYKKDYGLTVHVAKPLDLRTGFDRRTQLEESLVHSYLYGAYRKYAIDKAVTLIGLVPVDLYLENRPNASWGFGRLRGEPRTDGIGIDYREGIISIYRMDPRNWGLPADDDLRDERIRKMVSKYIAHAYYDLPLSNDPSSVTFNNIAGLTELDSVNEHMPVR